MFLAENGLLSIEISQKKGTFKSNLPLEVTFNFVLKDYKQYFSFNLSY